MSIFERIFQEIFLLLHCSRISENWERALLKYAFCAFKFNILLA